MLAQPFQLLGGGLGLRPARHHEGSVTERGFSPRLVSHRVRALAGRGRGHARHDGRRGGARVRGRRGVAGWGLHRGHEGLRAVDGHLAVRPGVGERVLLAVLEARVQVQVERAEVVGGVVEGAVAGGLAVGGQAPVADHVLDERGVRVAGGLAAPPLPFLPLPPLAFARALPLLLHHPVHLKRFHTAVQAPILGGAGPALLFRHRH